ncbi:MAG: hydantoinase/oxoprolinase N-terminal domain-containing protein [Candidatus Electronema sp. V4]|uniref:hydantoinase/oxoprolinase N-terminal domain-containing protein n=1 Tax=Candidatus Electronema sp. V4 TaxID=3454756 RepID=UPI0040556C0F
MDSYSIGIDTGGTCTDAVLISNSSLQVAHWVKEPTTHHDLGIGVGRALERLLTDSGIAPEAVNRLSVSTTLATNAVVEGRGARVGLLVFGHVRHFKLPVTASVFMKGGHKITGEEDEPLDIEGLVDSVRAIRGEVDSYAVCSAMSIKNPVHELVAEEAISILDPAKPVFCSHQVSGSPGMHGRAATACLHARLMPLMVGFLSSVQISMLKTGLSCPVTIICGSGRGASLDEAVRRAAITVASGPAATARFGCAAGERTALVVDVGGTTTDVCMIKDGMPVLSSEGCRIGQWQTHVEAIDMYTAGCGGDSHVICAAEPDRQNIRLEPVRVQPLAMTAALPDPADWLGCGPRSALVLLSEGVDGQTAAKDEILRCLQEHGPLNPETLARLTGLSGVPLEKRLERLASRQQIKLAGFTPADALHALGRLDIGSAEQARRGAAVLAAELGMDVESLCLRVVAETERTIETVILDYLARKVWPASEAAPFLSSRDNPYFTLSAAVKLPIIGLGAASRCFLPAVAERLRTSVSFPEHYEVGNAVGAAMIGREECAVA